MNHRKEAREATQEMYGGYCNMCREMDIEIVPYHKFSSNLEIYESVNKQYKSHKKLYSSVQQQICQAVNEYYYLIRDIQSDELKGVDIIDKTNNIIKTHTKNILKLVK